MPANAANARRRTPKPGQSTPSAREFVVPRTAAAFQPTSLKLPLALKALIDETAHKAGLSPHAFMLQTLVAATGQADLREQFQRDAQNAQTGMKTSSLGHELSTVRDYFTRLADFRAGKGRKPRKPSPKKID